MSLRKKGKEIQRLIDAFEKESSKFHDIKFRLIFLTQENLLNKREFESPNHAIMLWQYHGLFNRENFANEFVENLKDSNMKWGMRGAELTCFGVIEGETCALFVRMAKRATGLLNKKEIAFVQQRVIEELREKNKDIENEKISSYIANDNQLAIWLNYLLYYISKVAPNTGKATRIEPDLFSLSLLALEQLLHEPTIKKVDKSLRNVRHIKFKVALSFPGEKRYYVSKVVENLQNELKKDEVFYDFDYQSQLAVPDLDSLLQNIYRNNSDLVVVFLCEEYSQKEWCGLEWRAVKDIIKSKESQKIMFIRFDNANIDGVFSIDGYIDANRFSEKEISEFIMERVYLSSK